jgi:cytochrome c oxidase subunit IV
MTDHSSTSPAPSKAGYFMVFAMIAGLIFLAIGMSFTDKNSVYINLIIAAVQASLLGYYFMHLKGAGHLTWLIAGAGLFWIVILFLFVLTDYVTRHIAAY